MDPSSWIHLTLEREHGGIPWGCSLDAACVIRKIAPGSPAADLEASLQRKKEEETRTSSCKEEEKQQKEEKGKEAAQQQRTGNTLLEESLIGVRIIGLRKGNDTGNGSGSGSGSGGTCGANDDDGYGYSVIHTPKDALPFFKDADLLRLHLACVDPTSLLPATAAASTTTTTPSTTTTTPTVTTTEPPAENNSSGSVQMKQDGQIQTGAHGATVTVAENVVTKLVAEMRITDTSDTEEGTHPTQQQDRSEKDVGKKNGDANAQPTFPVAAGTEINDEQKTEQEEQQKHKQTPQGTDTLYEISDFFGCGGGGNGNGNGNGGDSIRTTSNAADTTKHLADTTQSPQTLRFQRYNQIDGAPLSLYNLHHCTIYCFDAVDSVTVDECTDLTLVVAACENSIFLRNCERFRLTAATKQLRLRDCSDGDIRLFAMTDPVIETSKRLQFRPYNARTPSGAQKFHRARLDPTCNRYCHIHDFTPSLVPSSSSSSSSPSSSHSAHTIQDGGGNMSMMKNANFDVFVFPNHSLEMETFTGIQQVAVVEPKKQAAEEDEDQENDVNSCGHETGAEEEYSAPAEIVELLLGKREPALSSEVDKGARSYPLQKKQNHHQQQPAAAAITSFVTTQLPNKPTTVAITPGAPPSMVSAKKEEKEKQKGSNHHVFSFEAFSS